MLSALGLAVKVTTQEDVGIDFYCNVGKRDGNALVYVAPYNVQVKSLFDTDLPYGGATSAGTWRQHSPEWILTQQTPLFAAVVPQRETAEWSARHEKWIIWSNRIVAGRLIHKFSQLKLPRSPL